MTIDTIFARIEMAIDYYKEKEDEAYKVKHYKEAQSCFDKYSVLQELRNWIITDTKKTDAQ